MKVLDKDLEAVGIRGAYEAFQSVKPWAYKADIWRYAVLWRHGGVYMDHECVLVKDLAYIVERLTQRQPFHVCADKGAGGGVRDKLWQGFVISEPRNPVLLHALAISIANVRKKVYNHALDITGPGVMRQAAKDFQPQCHKSGSTGGHLAFNRRPGWHMLYLNRRAKRSQYMKHFLDRDVYY